MNTYRLLLQAVGTGMVLTGIAAALPATAQPYPAQGGYGYPTPGSYPAPGGYPAPNSYPTPGGYPAPNSYPAPNGYPPALNSYPAPGSYPTPGSYPPPANPYPTNASSGSTTFICGRSGNDPATLVQANGRILRSPLIIWTTHYFGDEYTPQQRCQEVSARLTSAVAQNGGKLSNLRLSTGYVFGRSVVCFLNNASSCDPNNTLFTLKPENARNAPGVLARLANFGRYGGGSSVHESGSLGDGTSSAGTSVSLEDAVNQAVQAEGGAASEPGYQTGPSYQPAPDHQSGGGYSGGSGI